jgi:alkylhydroperoxidase/carboxymuconolactone decarboxylase family protein YurZ
MVEQNQLATAKRIGLRAVDANGRAVDPKLLAQAIDRPAAWLTAHERRLTQAQRELAMIAIARLARDNPESAAEFANALNLLLTPEQRGVVWGRIGHMAALRLMPEANDWYRRGGEHVGIGTDAARVEEVLEWQVRAALRAGDWLGEGDVGTCRRHCVGRPGSTGTDERATATGRPSAGPLCADLAAVHFTTAGGRELGRPIVLPRAVRLPEGSFRFPTTPFAAFKFYELGLARGTVKGIGSCAAWTIVGFWRRRAARSRGILIA